ncbi:T9SS type B sorting domain-containing protein [Crocinitomicaceae bacterium]|nr:T9SS type B sorting domain-containing protein [Crocinitomicaceae bacterium]
MKTRLFLFFTFFSFFTIAQVPNYAPTNGLVGWWGFNGNANDESGNGLDGTVNGATLTTDRYGNPNSAYDFDGVNDYISLVESSEITFNHTDDFTLSFWLLAHDFVNSYGNGNHVVYASKQGVNNGIGSTVSSPNNFYAQTEGDVNSVNTEVQSSELEDSTWTFFTVVYSHLRNKKYLYQNCTLIDSVEIQSNTVGVLTYSQFWLGKRTDYLPDNTYFFGKLDDFAIWNRSLSDAEIFSLYSRNLFDPPVVSLQETVSSCVSSATIDAGSEPSWETYNWSNGETTQSISTDFSGLYSVAVTDTNGCIGYDTTLVSVINPTISQIDTNICLGETLVLDVTPANSCTPLPLDLQDGLVGYYPFCGNANDESGNGNDGTVNGASLTTDRFGNSNSAYDFDGDDDFISINNFGSDILENDFSVSLWCAFDNFNNDYLHILYGENSFLVINGNGPSYFPNDSKISAYQGPLAPISDRRIPYFQTTDDLLINDYYHFALLKRQSKAYIYLNGVLTDSVTTDNNLPIPVGNILFIGSGYDNSNIFHMDGKIDDIGIWNRALSSSEIQQLYEHGNYDISWSTGETTPSITVQPSETTTYSVTLDDGISSCSDDVTITINDLVEAGIDVSVCNGDEITLSGSGGDTYIWSNGVTDGVSFTPGSSSYYYVTGTDSFGCETTDSVFVTLLEPTSSVIIETNCDNYTAPDGASYTVSGTYSAVIQNSVGCDSTITIDLTVLESPGLSFDVTDPSCQGESSGTIIVNATNGIEPYSFVWSNGVVEAENNNIGAGTYEVTVTDNLGCSTQGSVVVIDPTESCFLIPGGLSPNGDGANETWEIGGLSQYPDAIISVFDRWGQKVYSGDYTSPPWDGTYEGKNLPTADYYYILDLGNGEKYNGVVTLKR